MKRPEFWKHGFGVFVLLSGLSMLAATAAADTLTVTDFGDAGPGTLRDLVETAKSGDTIVIPPGTVIVDREIQIDRTLTIQGSVEARTSISGHDVTRVFSIGVANVTIKNLTITNGNASASDPTNPVGGGVLIAPGGKLTLIDGALFRNHANNGGAIYCGGTLETQSTGNPRTFLSENDATGDGGALVVAPGAVAILRDTTIAANIAGQGGGGIAVLGELDYSGSLVFRNIARFGGGIGIAQGGSATLSDLRFDRNRAAQGGAINNFVNASAHIDRSSFSSNQAVTAGSTPGLGGAIFNLGELDLAHSTVYFNTASVAGGGVFVGRGSSPTVAPGTADLVNVLLRDNSSSGNPAGGNATNVQGQILMTRSIVANGGCTGGVFSDGFNLTAANDCPGIGTGVGDKVNVGDLKLAPLGSWGGPTLTQPPLPGSLAIDGGGACIGTDQIGTPRPQGGACDIGPVEVRPFSTGGVGVNVPENGVAFQPGEHVTLTCNFLPGTAALARDYYCAAAVIINGTPLFVSLVPGPNGTVQPVVGPSLVPFATNTAIAQPFTVTAVHVPTAADPPAEVFVGAATTPPGTNPLVPSAAVAIDVKSFTLRVTTP